ncbi:hypothetical protein ACQP10_37305 [Streptosporangium sandarakinum]|uniref:hypothetical protein n=1 Tax=Streptosporangium sandarakinum TaxID=1260955 RepID=UPI003D8F6662
MRGAISAFSIMFGCALTPFALAGFWVADEISGSGRYVADVAPTAADPAVRDDVTDRVTAEISRSLPGMDRPATADLVRRSVNAVVTGGDFPAVWAELNRAAHRRVVSVLRDGPGRAAPERVDLDLTPVYGMARRELAAAGQAGASRLPDLHPRIELLPVRALLGARTACDWLVRLKWALPLLPVLPLAAGWSSRATARRRSAAPGSGWPRAWSRWPPGWPPSARSACPSRRTAVPRPPPSTRSSTRSPCSRGSACASSSRRA